MIYPPPNKVMKTDWFKTLRKSEFISSLIFLGIENPTNPCRFLSFDCEYHPAPFTQARQMFWENGSRHLDLNRGIFLNDSNGPTQHMSSKCWSPTETSERRFENHYPQKKWLKRHYQKKKKKKKETLSNTFSKVCNVGQIAELVVSMIQKLLFWKLLLSRQNHSGDNRAAQLCRVRGTII